MGSYAGDIENKGTTSEVDVWEKLFRSFKDDNNVIFGYKDPSIGKSAEETPSFILMGKEFGIILIDVIDDKFSNIDSEDEDFWVFDNGEAKYSREEINCNFIYEIENRLKQNKSTRQNLEQLNNSIRSIIVFSRNSKSEISLHSSMSEKISFITQEELNSLDEYINQFKTFNFEDNIFNEVMSELDSTNILNKSLNKPKVKALETMNDYIHKSLEYTFKLDETQRQIAKQIPSGPQRIRGLAGTGKTVILCMKAAIAHKMNPNSKILFVFNTKSMINEIKGIISKYYEKEAKKGVNWDNLEVLHAWGGADLEGLYSKTCKDIRINRLSFSDVKRSKDGLERIYSDLLNNKALLPERYDLVLIDEAQDFPPAFFETIFFLTKAPKRIIWAYDEFQSLKDIKILEPEEMFGQSKDGEFNMPNSCIQGTYMGDIKKDYALKNSYRNPGFNLMVAHSLALGLHRENGIIDVLPDKNSWESIGYEVEQPDHDSFEEGDRMVISRPISTCKNILANLLIENNINETSLIQFNGYNTLRDEIFAVAEKINQLIKEELIEPSQIFVITLDTKNSSETLKGLKEHLLIEYDINSIMPGFDYDTGHRFREDGYVTLTTPWKAKGNEANIVFVINAQKAYIDTSFKTRNALFVSITRSRAWCYISGAGVALEYLKTEVDEMINNKLKFVFPYPNEETLIKNRKKLLQRNTKDEQVSEFLADNEDLVIERLKNDPDLWNKIKQELEQGK